MELIQTGVSLSSARPVVCRVPRWLAVDAVAADPVKPAPPIAAAFVDRCVCFRKQAFSIHFAMHFPLSLSSFTFLFYFSVHLFSPDLFSFIYFSFINLSIHFPSLSWHLSPAGKVVRRRITSCCAFGICLSASMLTCLPTPPPPSPPPTIPLRPSPPNTAPTTALLCTGSSCTLQLLQCFHGIHPTHPAINNGRFLQAPRPIYHRTGGRKDRRTDGRTDGRTKPALSPSSLPDHHPSSAGAAL